MGLGQSERLRCVVCDEPSGVLIMAYCPPCNGLVTEIERTIREEQPYDKSPHGLAVAITRALQR